MWIRIISPGSHDYLLKWHVDYYLKKDLKRLSDKIYEGKNGQYQLTIQEKKRILLNNIYGVDIDPQAVEVTKLSLLLKVLEGENKDALEAQQKLFQERALPDLENNIKCGNSLIGPDIYNSDLELNNDDITRINPFDWNDEFSEIMTEGGFDAIIGNPPYGSFLSEKENDYFNQKFKLQEYQLDSYFIFIEKSIDLISKDGFFGMIIPNTWLLNLKTKKLRKNIFKKYSITNIVHYLFKVFKKATVDTEIVIIKNQKPLKNHLITIRLALIEKEEEYTAYQRIWADREGKPINVFEREEYISIREKLDKNTILDKVCLIRQGSKPFQVGKGNPPQTREIVDNKPFISNKKNDSTFRPLLRGSMMSKYQIKWNNDYWISFGDWLAEPRYSANYDAPQKIIIRQTGDSPIATLDSNQFIVRDNLYALTPKKEYMHIELSYILGIINSKLIKWYYQNILNPEKGEALAQVKRGHISQFPILIPKLDDKIHTRNHEALVKLVDNIMNLYATLAKSNTPASQQSIQRQIDATDKQIDNLVYDLYGLNDDEIQIVVDSLKD